MYWLSKCVWLSKLEKVSEYPQGHWTQQWMIITKDPVKIVHNVGVGGDQLEQKYMQTT